MKAFVLEKYGAPLREIEMPVPAPARGEILVRMVAAGLNPADERVRSGEFKAIFPFALPKVMGGEFSGEVVELGDGVAGFAVGDRVYGYVDLEKTGTLSEFIAVDAATAAPAPTSVSLVDAAGLPTAARTAWQSLVDMGKVTKGQTVLIHGGTGGVGSIAIQLAKHLGCTVATTVSGPNVEAARELGADIVIDYRNDDLVQSLAGTPVDFVLDTQGGDTLHNSLAVVRPGGIVIGISGPPDPQFARRVGVNPVVRTAIRAMSAKVRRRARSLGVTYRFLFISPDGEALRQFAGLVDDGVIRPVTDRVLPFDQAPKALDQLLAGGTRGKVLISTDPAAVTVAGAGSGAAAGASSGSSAAAGAGSSADADVNANAGPGSWVATPTRSIVVGGGAGRVGAQGQHTLTYRDLGPSQGTGQDSGQYSGQSAGKGSDNGSGQGVPLLLLAHLAATLDEWDPQFVDALARDRRVIAVDLPGVGGSSGSVPDSIAEMASVAKQFVDALGLTEIDLLGFSLGGFIAQQVALDSPQLVRRLVLAGTGPSGGKGIDRKTGGAYIYWDMIRGALARTDAKEFLFFPRTPTGKAAAKAYLGRLDQRVMDRDTPIAVPAFRQQIAAIRAWGSASPQDLSRITAPTLIGNGDHDRMVPTELSRDMHARIPGSTLIIYPDSGHGGVFQYGDEFASAVREHLDRDGKDSDGHTDGHKDNGQGLGRIEVEN